MSQMSVNMVSIYEFVSMMSTELLFLLFFGLGFFALSGSIKPRKSPKATIKKVSAESPVDHWKTIEIESQAGHLNGVLAAWRAASKDLPTPAEAFRYVCEAFVQQDKDSLVKELTMHIKMNRLECCNVKVAAAILEVVARAGDVEIMEQIMKFFSGELRLVADLRMYDVLIGGYASAGLEEKVSEVIADLKGAGHKVSARGFSLSIKGFLKNGMADAALKQLLAMRECGFNVPSFAVGQIFRAASDAHRCEEFFNALEPAVPLPAEAVYHLFDEFCVKHRRLDLIDRIEAWARRSNVPVSSGAYDWLLKHWASTGDIRAISLFKEMHKSGARMSEALYVTLLARCAEAKFLRFAELIVSSVKASQTMTIAMYSALMKVYAMSSMYDKACDIYEEIIAKGLEPDAMMYGCLMKFSVDCGRTALAKKLFDKAPRLEIQNYMSLIRAAGRDGDIDRAFAILEKLQDSDVPLDLAAYNCVLDVCVSLGRIDRARDLITDMKKFRAADIVTWNTLLKGFCSKGDLVGAKGVITEMEHDGLRPNDISFNCLINAAISSANFPEAWNFVRMMEDRGIPPDHYTMSILMKPMRKAKANKDAGRALALLDKSGLNVFTDEVLLNTVVEVCMRHKEHKRLHGILDALPHATIKPSVHTYGTLIKACSTLHRIEHCQQLWDEMVSVRALQPNEIALGCMLDALVCNGRVNDAVALLDEWKTSIPPNAVMYSTIIKGFASVRQSENAMKVWQKMRESGSKISIVTYNSIIDSQARTGAMDAVFKLVAAMCEDGLMPDAITSSTIAKGYCVKGDVDRAVEVFEHMQCQGMVHDVIIYNTLLDGCARHGRSEIAQHLLKDMKEHRISPTNTTLASMVKLYARCGQLDLAVEAVKTWPVMHKVVPNGQTWTTLMCSFLNEGDLDSASRVFEQMKQANITPEAKAYGSLMAGYVRKGNLSKALGILDEAHGMGRAQARALPSGQWLDVEHLDSLVLAVASRQGTAAASVLVRRLIAAKTPLNAKVMAYAEPQ